MAKFKDLVRSGNIAHIRILLVSKTNPQIGVGVKYNANGANVVRNVVPLVSQTDRLAPDSKTRVIQKVVDVPPELFALLSQAYEYTSRWASGEIDDIRSFIGISSIGDLQVYGNFDS